MLADIENERLIPTATIPQKSARFEDDLSQLQEHLLPNKAAYILLKVDPEAADGYVAVTYVPNAAPVRQKMLVASTRLTLVRELGIERFRETLLVTEKSELTAEGWKKHQQHSSLSAPLTEEEAGLAGVKEAEAQESQGTSARRGHVTSKVNIRTGDGVVEALALLKEEGCKGTLVQLKFELPNETLVLDSSKDSVSPNDVAKAIHASEPRYSFYSSLTTESPEPEIVFIYTCPTASKIKERMVYSTGKSWTRTVAERDAGLVISRSLEATETHELTLDSGNPVEGTQDSGRSTPAGGAGGFQRPKRPGRR